MPTRQSLAARFTEDLISREAARGNHEPRGSDFDHMERHEAQEWIEAAKVEGAKVSDMLADGVSQLSLADIAMYERCAVRLLSGHTFEDVVLFIELTRKALVAGAVFDTAQYIERHNTLTDSEAAA